MNGSAHAVLPRLSRARLAALPAAVARPAWALDAARIGIVHFGPGAFHRAHQAAFIDDLLASHPEWAISAVSLHNPAVSAALRPQDGLYTLARLAAGGGDLRVLGAIREWLHAPSEPAAVLARLADPGVRLVTLTVTEKGYALAGNRLDVTRPEIAHDLRRPEAPRSVIGWLVAGLAARRRAGLAPFTVLSCDNLPENGRRLRSAVLQFAQHVAPALAIWIATEVAFPCSMVDSITPASDDALRARVAGALGCLDAWPVESEAYLQWVIEDRFCNLRPPLETVGATFTRDVAGHAQAKLRLLNGAHSTLAWLGALLELDSVADAMATPVLAGFVERLMRGAILPATRLPAGLDGGAYIDAILQRFRNPAIRHRLLQIAWDSSQKLPVRLLASVRDALARGHDISAFGLAIAAWLHFVRRQARRGIPLVDPLAEPLAALGRACRGDADADVASFLALDTVFGDLATDPRFTAALRHGYTALGEATPQAVAAALAGA